MIFGEGNFAIDENKNVIIKYKNTIIRIQGGRLTVTEKDFCPSDLECLKYIIEKEERVVRVKEIKKEVLQRKYEERLLEAQKQDELILLAFELDNYILNKENNK